MNNSHFGKEFTEEDEEYFKNPNFYFIHHWGFLKRDVEKSEYFNTNKFLRALGWYKAHTNKNDNNLIGRKIREDEDALAIFEHAKFPWVAW